VNRASTEPLGAIGAWKAAQGGDPEPRRPAVEGGHLRARRAGDALGTLPQDTMKNAAGLYNLMRDLGGAIGLAPSSRKSGSQLTHRWRKPDSNHRPRDTPSFRCRLM